MANRDINVIGYFTQQYPSMRYMGSDHVVKCMEVILSKFPVFRIQIRKGASRTKVLGMYHDVFIAKNTNRAAEFAAFEATTMGSTTTALELARATPIKMKKVVQRRNFQLHGFVVHKDSGRGRPSAAARFATAAPLSRAPTEVNIIQTEEEVASMQKFVVAVEAPLPVAASGIGSFLTKKWNKF